LLATSIIVASFIEPAGQTTVEILYSAIFSIESGFGKNPSEVRTAPSKSLACPLLRALSNACSTAPTRSC